MAVVATTNTSITPESPPRRYLCPMHPHVVQEMPGRCPECGMQLVQGDRVSGVGGREQHDHDQQAGHGTRQFAQKFWVSLLLTIPVVFTSELAVRVLRLPRLALPGGDVLPAVLGTIVFFYGGWVFLAGAWREIRGRLPGMMTLIALAITTAYVYSVAVTVTGRGMNLFWELTTLITVMLLGHLLEMRAVQGAQSALRELSKLLPDTAEVVRGESTRRVPLSELPVGDVVLVRPGGKIPADGAVLEGTSEMNEAIVTGESKPVPKSTGDAVIAGTLNGDGALHVRVEKIGEQTFLAGVMRLVAEAQASRSRLQVLSDRAALALTGIALSAGVVTFVSWMLARAGVAVAVERVVAVLVIACPHALGLAVPLVASISTTLGARHGLLVRQRLALETARRVDTILFDKTGTLTTGEFGVTNVWALGGADEREVLRLAAAVEARAEHAVARAILRKASDRGVEPPTASAITRLPGQGVRGVLENEDVLVGSPAILPRGGAELPPAVRDAVRAEGAQGKTIVFVRRGDAVVGAIALADTIREESRQAIRALRDLGINVAMVTGDAEDVARWVAGELGIAEVFARVPPDKKAQTVRDLQAAGRHVAFVGDGVNDAPALAQADVGIAIGAGTNVAIESAGILLVRNDPQDIVRILTLSRATYRKMLQNLFWATGYNIVALPLAAGVLAAQGILLEPAVAALLMSASTVIVAVNALLLRRQPL